MKPKPRPRQERPRGPPGRGRRGRRGRGRGRRCGEPHGAEGAKKRRSERSQGFLDVSLSLSIYLYGFYDSWFLFFETIFLFVEWFRVYPLAIFGIHPCLVGWNSDMNSPMRSPGSGPVPLLQRQRNCSTPDG